jgi:hypothetical protein
MQAFEPDHYSAFGSFHPVYIEVERYFFEYRDWHTQRVLHALSIHADPVGCSWIGIRGLASFTGLSETNVKRAILRLGELGWLRAHIYSQPTRRIRSIDWQLSPAVIWIAPDHIQMALEVWKAGILKLNEIINQQPENLVNQHQNQLNQPKPDNHHQNHHHHQNPEPSNPEVPREGRDQVDPEKDEPDQRDAQTPATAGRSDQRQQIRRSAPPPPDLERCRQPLADADSERIAGNVQAQLGTRIVQARQLVLWFGALKVNKALEWLAHEMSGGFRPRSRFGLVRSWLQDDVILEDESPAALERKSYIHGQYSEWIKS